jgi:hypothetical protein
VIDGDWTISEYDVILEEVGANRVRVMKAIREATPVPPNAIKAHLAVLPRPLLTGAHCEDAYATARALHAAGARVRVARHAYEVLACAWAGDGGPPRTSETTTTDVPQEWWQ